MTTRFMIRDNKGLFLREEAAANDGIISWAIDRDLGMVFDYLREAKKAVSLLPGGTIRYTIEPVKGVSYSEELQDFKFKWQHREGYLVERKVEGLTEMEMINRIFEEARDHNLPIINAEVRVAEKVAEKVVKIPIEVRFDKSM